VTRKPARVREKLSSSLISGSSSTIKICVAMGFLGPVSMVLVKDAKSRLPDYDEVVTMRQLVAQQLIAVL
jgi:hypothetical protein